MTQGDSLTQRPRWTPADQDDAITRDLHVRPWLGISHLLGVRGLVSELLKERRALRSGEL